MTDIKLDELLTKVKTTCHKDSVVLDDDTIKDYITKFYEEYEKCKDVDRISVLLTCNECKTDEEKDDNFSESQIVEASFWDIKIKNKGYGAVPYPFIRSRFGLEAFYLILSCRDNSLKNVGARLWVEI